MATRFVLIQRAVRQSQSKAATFQMAKIKKPVTPAEKVLEEVLRNI